jgi:hypothetical protein
MKQPELAARALAVVSRTPGVIAKMLVNEPRQSWSRDFKPLRKYPLIEILPDRFACPDMTFLGDYLCYGVYYALIDAFGDGGDEFRALFGYVFEEYMNDLIRQFAYGGKVLARRFYPGPTFADGAQVADSIIHWGDTALLAEYKAGQLTTYQKYAAPPDVLMEAIDDLLICYRKSSKGRRKKKKGAGQLADSIVRIVAGEKVFGDDHSTSSELDLSTCRIVPALITFDEALGLRPVQRRAQRKLQEVFLEENVDCTRIEPVLILTVEDMEILESLQGVAPIERVILDYAEYLRQCTEDVVGTFHDFAYNEFPGHKIDQRSFTREMATSLFQDTMTDLSIPPAEASES